MLIEESGIAPAVVAERGYRSVTDARELARLGFSQRGLTAPGLLLPLWAPDGTNGRYVYRPDAPRALRGKALKYEMPKGGRASLDVPPRCRGDVKNPAVPLWVTEGLKKADALAAAGKCAVGLLGVWMWKGRNDYDAVTVLPEWDEIALKGRDVRLVFDSDVSQKSGVWQAMMRLKAWLAHKGAHVRCIQLPPGPDGEKVGADDYLLAHTPDELDALIAAPEPVSPEEVEWLDAAPVTLARPLALVDGRAYAASWIPVRRRQQDDDGCWVETVETARIIVRDDGEVYGPGGRTTADLGITVQLAQPIRDYHAWTVPSLKAFKAGLRPNFPDVFRRLVETYDYFLDFPRSPEGQVRQPIMCEVSACFSLATWLTAALTVVGYPWPNGPAGSGKTKWATIWAGTSYLGQLVLSSGSFASIRDLADYGAAIAFDDAEGLADPKKSDPQKRELLLAGHHRGTVVPLKEPAADGKGWVTRFLDPFGFKAFTAIRLPDPVLSSRSIIIPLVKTASEKANRDPSDHNRWPHDQRRLQDDLWATALTLLPRAPERWAALEGETSLFGRDFEPWRPVLLAATLLEEAGVPGLVQRIRGAMAWYQDEKADYTLPDRTILVIRALLAMLKADPKATPTDSIYGIYTNDSKLEWAVAAITDSVKALATEEGIDDTDWMTVAWVGRVLSQLRFQRGSDGKRRQYRLAPSAIIAAAEAYGLLPKPPPPPKELTEETAVNGSPAVGGAGGPHDASHAHRNAVNAVNAVMLSTAPGAQHASPPPAPFVPTAEWQELPPGAGVSVTHCEYKMRLDGTNQVRLGPAVAELFALAGERGWPALQAPDGAWPGVRAGEAGYRRWLAGATGSAIDGATVRLRELAPASDGVTEGDGATGDKAAQPPSVAAMVDTGEEEVVVWTA